MTDNIDFESIRPYRDEEVPMVFERLTKEQSFLRLLKFLYPDVPTDKFVDRLRAIKTIDQFQHDVIYSYLKGIMKNTTDGVTASGLENLDSSKNYLFISNHRDIVLDSAFLNIMLM